MLSSFLFLLRNLTCVAILCSVYFSLAIGDEGEVEAIERICSDVYEPRGELRAGECSFG